MVSGDSQHYLDLSASYFQLGIKVTKSDGVDLDDTTAIALINLIGQTIFSQLDVHLNDVLIPDASNLYHYRAMFETLLSYGTEAKKFQLTMALYYEDTAGTMNTLADNNIGFKNRKAFSAKSRTIQLIGRFHSDMFFQNQYLLNGVDLRIKLLRNTDTLVLMAATNSDFKVKIENASLFIRKVKINNGIYLKHLESLDKQLRPAIYPIRRVHMKTFRISTGSLSYNEDNIFNGVLPKRIIMGFVSAERFEGTYVKNPFNFEHKELKYASILIDGKMAPQKPLISDLTNKLSLRNYFSLLESTGQAFIDDGLDIDRNEYNSGYSLLCFDLTPDLEEGNCYHIVKKGNIRLELKFDCALDEPINVIVYSEFDGAIKIDKNRSHDQFLLVGKMNSRQIYTILKHDPHVTEQNFLGCFPLGRIPESAKSFPCV